MEEWAALILSKVCSMWGGICKGLLALGLSWLGKSDGKIIILYIPNNLFYY